MKRTPSCSASALTTLCGRDDDDARGRNADVAQDQRQDALPDAAETDHDDAPGKIDVDLVTHDVSINDLSDVSWISSFCQPGGSVPSYPGNASTRRNQRASCG